MRFLTLAFALLASPLAAHEFWLEPHAYRIETDGRLVADIVNGQNFEGVKLPFVPQRFAHFVIFSGAASETVKGRVGDTPAMDIPPLAEGLNIVAYQARNATVGYESWEKFQSFVDHKDLGDVLSRHTERGLPDADFTEVYSRYSKTLVGVGNSAGADKRAGLETEFVALTNPYTDNLSAGMQVQLFYRKDVRADTQVEVFEKTPDGAVSTTFYRTDADGIATINVTSGNSYMVDAVVLREPTEQLAADTNAVWETLWANLTFMAP